MMSIRHVALHVKLQVVLRVIVKECRYSSLKLCYTQSHNMNILCVEIRNCHLEYKYNYTKSFRANY